MQMHAHPFHFASLNLITVFLWLMSLKNSAATQCLLVLYHRTISTLFISDLVVAKVQKLFSAWLISVWSANMLPWIKYINTYIIWNSWGIVQALCKWQHSDVSIVGFAKEALCPELSDKVSGWHLKTSAENVIVGTTECQQFVWGWAKLWWQ